MGLDPRHTGEPRWADFSSWRQKFLLTIQIPMAAGTLTARMWSPLSGVGCYLFRQMLFYSKRDARNPAWLSRSLKYCFTEGVSHIVLVAQDLCSLLQNLYLCMLNQFCVHFGKSNLHKRKDIIQLLDLDHQVVARQVTLKNDWIWIINTWFFALSFSYHLVHSIEQKAQYGIIWIETLGEVAYFWNTAHFLIQLRLQLVTDCSCIFSRLVTPSQMVKTVGSLFTFCSQGWHTSSSYNLYIFTSGFAHVDSSPPPLCLPPGWSISHPAWKPRGRWSPPEDTSPH